jgi:hypothetical protein
MEQKLLRGGRERRRKGQHTNREHITTKVLQRPVYGEAGEEGTGPSHTSPTKVSILF